MILRAVNLSKNKLLSIGSLGDNISGKQLMILNVARNNITTIKGLESLLNLRFLNMSYNKLTTIESLASCCPQLVEGYFDNNQI